jgi:hypothetical protein
MRTLLLSIVILYSSLNISAQTTKTELINQIINSDSSLFNLNFCTKVAYLPERDLCKRIAYYFENKKNEFYEKYALLGDTSVSKERLKGILDSLFTEVTQEMDFPSLID